MEKRLHFLFFFNVKFHFFNWMVGTIYSSFLVQHFYILEIHQIKRRKEAIILKIIIIKIMNGRGENQGTQ